MLLKSAGIDFKILEPHVDESVRPNERPDDYVRRLAEAKADYVARESELVVVAADTAVVLDSEILGKPVDENDARSMLRSLSGREHQVLTGFAVKHQAQTHVAVVTTRVTFRPLTTHDIERYLITKESMDKAGAYAIQGIGAALIDRIDGSFTNVIGLPLKEVVEAIHDLVDSKAT